MIFLTFKQAVGFNQKQIEILGGSFGMRDSSLLESALEMPKQGFGDEYLHDFPFEMAAAYLYHISKNHPFLDGNKRTALHVCLTFLKVNGYQCTLQSPELEDFTVEVATGVHSKAAIAKKLEENCTKLPWCLKRIKNLLNFFKKTKVELI